MASYFAAGRCDLKPFYCQKEGDIDFFERIREVRAIIGDQASIHVQVIAQDYEGILKMLLKFVSNVGTVCM